MVYTIHLSKETRDRFRILKAQRRHNTYEELVNELIEQAEKYDRAN